MPFAGCRHPTYEGASQQRQDGGADAGATRADDRRASPGLERPWAHSVSPAPQPRVHWRLESSRGGCFCAQKPYAHSSLQQSLDVKHLAPRARHSDAPGACAFVTPVGFDPAQATRAAATTTAETSCFMGATSSTQPKQRAGHRSGPARRWLLSPARGSLGQQQSSGHAERERKRACHDLLRARVCGTAVGRRIHRRGELPARAGRRGRSIAAAAKALLIERVLGTVHPRRRAAPRPNRTPVTALEDGGASLRRD